MKKIITAIAIATSFFAASSTMAAEGQQEFSLQGSIDNSSTSGTSSSTIFILGSYGQYLTPVLVVQGNAMMMGNDSGGSTFTTLGLGAGVKYYFGQGAKSQWVPFAIAGVNYISMDAGGSSGNGYGLDAGVGASNFITENVSFDVTAQLYSNTVTFSGFDSTTDGNRLTAGVTIRF